MPASPPIDSKQQELRRRLQQRITFEFVGQPLLETVDFLRTLTKITIIVDPKIVATDADQRPITLRVTDMEFELALKWVLKLAELNMKFAMGPFISRIRIRKAAPPAAGAGLEKELSESRQKLTALLRDKRAVEEDLALQTRRIEQLLKSGLTAQQLFGDDKSLSAGAASVSLTREQIVSLLEQLPKSADLADARLELYRKLARLSSGIEAAKVLAAAIAEFGDASQAELLAQDFVTLIGSQNDAKTLDALLTLRSITDCGRGCSHGARCLNRI